MTIPLIMEKYFNIFSSGNLNSNATKQNIKIRNPTGYAMGFFFPRYLLLKVNTSLERLDFKKTAP